MDDVYISSMSVLYNSDYTIGGENRMTILPPIVF